MGVSDGAQRMGPYQYRPRTLDIGLFSSIATAERRIQEEIDKHVADGWELFQIHPAPLSFSWTSKLLLVFRKPAEDGEQA